MPLVYMELIKLTYINKNEELTHINKIFIFNSTPYIIFGTQK